MAGVQATYAASEDQKRWLRIEQRDHKKYSTFRHHEVTGHNCMPTHVPDEARLVDRV